MKVWHSLAEIPGNESAVVTIGNFDGMHNGHKKVIATCVERARKLGVDAVAITFDPHPIQVHRPEVGLQLISPLRDRLDAMAAAGLDATLVAHYDASVYSLDADEFVDEYLVGRCGAREVVVGEDFRFGRANAGTIDTLRALGRSYGFDVITVTDIEAPEGRRWSSSWVRELLAAGDVSGAARVLGHLHRIRGSVCHGFKRGRALGFPTANLSEDVEGVSVHLARGISNAIGRSVDIMMGQPQSVVKPLWNSYESVAVERPWIIHAAVAAEAIVGAGLLVAAVRSSSPRSGWMRFAGIVGGLMMVDSIAELSLAKHVSKRFARRAAAAAE